MTIFSYSFDVVVYRDQRSEQRSAYSFYILLYHQSTTKVTNYFVVPFPFFQVIVGLQTMLILEHNLSL